MSASFRLLLCVMMIFGSAVYAILVARNPELASALALGYVSMLLTVLVIINVWKKP